MSKHARTTTRSRRKAPQAQADASATINHQREGSTIQLALPMAPALHLRHCLDEVLIQAGVLIVQAYLQDEVEQRAGPRYAHGDGSPVRRHGFDEGHAIIAGKKVAVQKPRIRADGKEVPLERYRAFSDPRILEDAVHRQMLLGISTRRYEEAVEGFGEGYGIRKGSVSRRWKAASARDLAQLVERPLGELDLVGIMVDGVHFGDTTVIAALGIAGNGQKHVLGLWSGATESAATVGGLLDDLIARGLDPNRRRLWGIDGSQALAKAIRERFPGDPVQRCLVHKKRNILAQLPKQYHAGASLRLAAAWGMTAYAEAKAALGDVVTFLEGISIHAARSLEEAFEETRTLQRIDVPTALRAFFASTNAIENLFGTVRQSTRRVKRWRQRPARGAKSQDMTMRWAAATVLAAEKRFHRIKGHKAMPEMIQALQAIDRRTRTA